MSMVFAVAALKYVCVWILKQRGQYCNRFSLEKIISIPNVFGFAFVRAGEGDFRCRIFDVWKHAAAMQQIWEKRRKIFFFSK